MATHASISAYEELARGFERSQVFPHMHSYDLYRKWLEATWAFLNAPLDDHAFRECLDKYPYEQGAEFGRLLGVYTQAVEDMPFQDILGELFMRLDVNSVRAGQFMTPYHIAEMMARMEFSREDFESLVAEKGQVTVCDPAVGSGVMLLAFARVVHDELGRPALSKLKLYGTDIDERCVLMTRIQLRMNGLDTFGRMAGLLGSLLHAEEIYGAPSTTTPSELNTTLASSPEPPDLSTAVILHSEERQRPADITAEQLALF
jgi:hypothetical protein